MTKEYILEQLNKYCTFDDTLSDGTFYENIVRPLEDAGCFNGWGYENGATKGVLIFSDLDYVIKIPFCCCYYEEEGYYDDNYEWIVECEGGPGEMFGGIEVQGYVHNNEWDYCETEMYRYMDAEKAGMAEHFARTWFLGKVQNHPIYAQSRASMFRSDDAYESRSKKSYTKEDYDSANRVYKGKSFYVEEEWLIDFIHYWGEERANQFAEFCDQEDIEDLHCGNIGYICGVPCLVDYSGFNN